MAEEPTLPKKPKMGMLVKDRISGFEGIMVSDAGYLNGCRRALVQPKALEENTKLPECVAFDVPDLVPIDWGVCEPPKKGRAPGGPRALPGRSKY